MLVGGDSAGGTMTLGEITLTLGAEGVVGRGMGGGLHHTCGGSQ